MFLPGEGTRWGKREWRVKTDKIQIKFFMAGDKSLVLYEDMEY